MARKSPRCSKFWLAGLGSLLSFATLAQNQPAYVIATIAGSGPANVAQGGYGGDGGPATKALLNLPTSVALGPADDLYFCDWNARIRRIDLRTGIVSNFAGTGVWGFAGDGGPASNALLGGPGDLAVDSAGNVYFADPYNARVRRIAAGTGIITTVAGNGAQFDLGKSGPAIDVAMGLPSGIAVDSAGNVYVSNGADRVRKIDMRTGISTVVAGAGGSVYSGDGGPATRAQLDQPSGLAVDGEDNLYIAARGEHRIRKVTASTGIITTIAGVSFGTNTGPPMGIIVYQGGFSGDGGLAVNATLNDPDGLAVDSTGNVYISDTMNYRVRRINASNGVIETIAGTGTRGFSGDGGSALNAEITTPAGSAVDALGRVFFADLFNQRIRLLSPPHPLLTPALIPNRRLRTGR